MAVWYQVSSPVQWNPREGKEANWPSSRRGPFSCPFSGLRDLDCRQLSMHLSLVLINPNSVIVSTIFRGQPAACCLGVWLDDFDLITGEEFGRQAVVMLLLPRFHRTQCSFASWVLSWAVTWAFRRHTWIFGTSRNCPHCTYVFCAR